MSSNTDRIGAAEDFDCKVGAASLGCIRLLKQYKISEPQKAAGS